MRKAAATLRAARPLSSTGGWRVHDLGLFEAPGAPHPPTGSITGLYHLRRLGAYPGESDHGATLSIYGADPDANEFEVMWQLPREQWVEHETTRPYAGST